MKKYVLLTLAITPFIINTSGWRRFLPSIFEEASPVNPPIVNRAEERPAVAAPDRPIAVAESSEERARKDQQYFTELRKAAQKEAVIFKKRADLQKEIASFQVKQEAIEDILLDVENPEYETGYTASEQQEIAEVNAGIVAELKKQITKLDGKIERRKAAIQALQLPAILN